MNVDALFTRIGCAGTSIQGYAPGARGQIAKVITAVSRVALIAIAACMIGKVIPIKYVPFAIGIPASLTFLSFCGGSGHKRMKKTVAFELLLLSISAALITLGLLGKLPFQRIGIAVVTTTTVGVLLLTGGESSIPKQPKDAGTPNCFLRGLDSLSSTLRDAVFTTKTLFTQVIHTYPSIKDADQPAYDTVIPNENKPLYVFIHGLNGRPSIFDDYEVKEGIAYRPHVYKKGQCSLDDATAPLLQVISNWSTGHPNQAITIVGVSNGARIAANLACQLGTGTTVHCIAGPFDGTKKMNRPDWTGCLGRLWRWGAGKLHHPSVVEEMAAESTRSQQLVTSMVQANNVTFNFYATTADSMILPYTSAFPQVPGQMMLVHTDGHNSIVRSVQDHILPPSSQ